MKPVQGATLPGGTGGVPQISPNSPAEQRESGAERRVATFVGYWRHPHPNLLPQGRGGRFAPTERSVG
jgi:hypothetical protein